MFGFAGSSKVVVLAREDHQLRINAVMFERTEPLFALLERDAVIVVGMQNQRWRFHVPGVLQRRSIPILLEIVEQDALEIFLVTVAAVASSFIADEVGDAAQCDRRLEAGGVTQDPIGQEAPVATSGEA